MWPFDDPQPFNPMGVSFLPSQPPAPQGGAGYLDPRMMRFNAGLGGLTATLGALSDAFQVRPANQPRPSIGAAAAQFAPAYNQALGSQYQQAQLQQGAQQTNRWNDIVEGRVSIPGLDPQRLEMLRVLGPQMGPQALATIATQRTAQPMNPQQSIAAFGSVIPGAYYDEHGAPALPRGPMQQGAIAGAEATGRVGAVGQPVQGVGLFVPPGTPAATMYGIGGGGAAQPGAGAPRPIMTPGAAPAPTMGQRPLPGGQPGVDRPYTAADIIQTNPGMGQAEAEILAQSANEAMPIGPGGTQGAPAAPRMAQGGGGAPMSLPQPSPNVQRFGAGGGALIGPQGPGDQTQERVINETLGNQFRDITAAETASRQQINQLNRVRAAYTGIDSGGPAAETMLRLRGYLQQAGIPIGADVSREQAAVAMSNELALQMRNPASGAGMPGAMSDADRQFLQGISPGLAQTPQGRELIIDARTRMLQRDQEVAQFTRQYMRQHSGRLDLDFGDAVQSHFASRPLFGQDFQRRQQEIMGTTPPAASGGGGAAAPATTQPPQGGTPPGPQIMPPVGATATNPRTGARARFDGRQWVPIPAGQR